MHAFGTSRIVLAALLLFQCLAVRAEIIKNVDSFAGNVEWESYFSYEDYTKGYSDYYYYPGIGSFTSIMFRKHFSSGTPVYLLQFYREFSSYAYFSYNASATLKYGSSYISLGQKLNPVSEITYGVFDASPLLAYIQQVPRQPIAIRVSGDKGVFDVELQDYMIQEWLKIIPAQPDTTIESLSGPLGAAALVPGTATVSGYVYHPTSMMDPVDLRIYVNGELTAAMTAEDPGQGLLGASQPANGVYSPRFLFQFDLTPYLSGQGKRHIDIFGIGLKGVNSHITSIEIESQTDADCVFDGAERNLANLFPEHATTNLEGDNYVRRYTSGALLAINLNGDVLYRLHGEEALADGGNINSYRAIFGCP